MHCTLHRLIRRHRVLRILRWQVALLSATVQHLGSGLSSGLLAAIVVLLIARGSRLSARVDALASVLDGGSSGEMF